MAVLCPNTAGGGLPRCELHVGTFLVNAAPDRRPPSKLPRPGACRYIINCMDKLPVCHRYAPVLQAKRRKDAEVMEAGKPNAPEFYIQASLLHRASGRKMGTSKNADAVGMPVRWIDLHRRH